MTQPPESIPPDQPSYGAPPGPGGLAYDAVRLLREKRHLIRNIFLALLVLVSVLVVVSVILVGVSASGG